MCAASENAFTLTVLLLSVRQTDSVRHSSSERVRYFTERVRNVSSV